MTRGKNVARSLAAIEKHLDAIGRKWVEDDAEATGEDLRLVTALEVEHPAPPATAAALLAVAKERRCPWLILRSEVDTTRFDLIKGLSVYEDD